MLLLLNTWRDMRGNPVKNTRKNWEEDRIIYFYFWEMKGEGNDGLVGKSREGSHDLGYNFWKSWYLPVIDPKSSSDSLKATTPLSIQPPIASQFLRTWSIPLTALRQIWVDVLFSLSYSFSYGDCEDYAQIMNLNKLNMSPITHWGIFSMRGWDGIWVVPCWSWVLRVVL